MSTPNAPAPRGSKKPLVALLLLGCGGLLFLMLACGAGGSYYAYLKWTEAAARAQSELTQLTPKEHEQPTPPADPPEKEPADDRPTYRLRVKSFPDAGRATRVTSKYVTTGYTRSVAVEGRSFGQDLDTTREEVYTCVVLTGGATRPRKFQEVYEKALQIGTSTRTLPQNGSTVTYDLQGDSYAATVPDTALNPNEQADLNRHARLTTQDLLALPANPVHVGDTWKPDVPGLAALLLGDCTVKAETSVTARLEDVFEKDGKRWARVALEVRLTAEVKQGSAALASPLTVDVKGTHEFVLDGPGTQGRLTLKGKVEGHRQFKPSGSADYVTEVSLEEERGPETDPPKEPAPGTPVWQTLVSQPGRCSVEFPGKAKYTAGHGMEFTDAKGVEFSVTWTEYRGAIMPPRTTDELMKHLVGSDTRKAKDQQFLRLDGGFGVQYTAELSYYNEEKKQSFPFLVRERAYVYGQRLYKVRVQAPKDMEVPPETVKRFLESFKLL